MRPNYSVLFDLMSSYDKTNAIPYNTTFVQVTGPTGLPGVNVLLNVTEAIRSKAEYVLAREEIKLVREQV